MLQRVIVGLYVTWLEVVLQLSVLQYSIYQLLLIYRFEHDSSPKKQQTLDVEMLRKKTRNVIKVN